jgi:SOS-response transcriptional repressor LexA
MNASQQTVLEAIAQAGKPATTSEVQVAMNLALWRITHESLESLEKEGLVTRAANKTGTPLWTLKAEGWAALLKGESTI